MKRRLLAAAAGVALLAVTAGCFGFGGGSIPAEQLDRPPAKGYAWDANADVHITVTENANFRAVYTLNESSIQLYRNDGFGGRNPLDVSAVRYRYPNGTVITGSEIIDRGGSITRNRNVVNVTVPPGTPSGGQLAFTASSTPKRFSLPTFVEGSYEVVLPEGRRVDFPLFGSISPRSGTATIEDGRVHVRWDEVTARSIVVQFYLQRDLLIFGAITAGLAVVAVGGMFYYRRKIDALKAQREELGLDVEREDDDDFGRGPPPGRP